MTRLLTWRRVVGVLLLASVAACGGGSDAPSNPIPPPAAITPTLSVYAGSLQQVGSRDGLGAAAQFNGPTGLVHDSAGNAYVADTGNHTIRKLSPAGAVTTIAGAAGQAGSTDGAGGAARFSSPSGLAIDGSGNLYVADTGNHTIRKISLAGVVSTVAGVAGQPGAIDGAAGVARLETPVSVAVDGGGNLFVVAGEQRLVGQTSVVRKVTPDGRISTFIPTRPNTPAFSAVAVNRTGNVFVMIRSSFNLYGGSVLKYDSTGQTQTFTTSGGAFASAFTVDSAGNVLVVNAGGFQAGRFPVRFRSIEKITPDGSATTVVNLLDSRITIQPLSNPLGVSVAPDGTLLIADAQDRGVFRVDAEQKFSPFAGGLGAGLADGPGPLARFSLPGSLASTADGTVFVADRGNNRVRRISPDGTVSTLAEQLPRLIQITGAADGSLYLLQQLEIGGLGISKTSPNGTISSFGSISNQSGVLSVDSSGRLMLGDFTGLVRLDRNGTTSIVATGLGAPSAMVTSPDGVIYVASLGVIRAIDSQGRVTVLAGLADSSGYVDGAGGQARFANIGSLTIDAAGNLYAADFTPDEGSFIRKITPVRSGQHAYGWSSGPAIAGATAQFCWTRKWPYVDGWVFVCLSE